MNSGDRSDPLTAERWERIQALFHAAVEVPPGEQMAMLRAACGDDERLLSDVAALLAEDARGDSLLDRERTAVAAAAAPWTPVIDGRTFGPYRIVRKLGEGGMGVVYLAERADVGSTVAVKFLRDAWLSPSRRERFASERRTLARLVHPSIARLYDADMLDDGTPWFAMEYVEGAPITQHCARSEMAVAERLRLFRAACEAVRYAHAQAIIHRDLKPSNILVKADGSVRLLDFGIAKQLDAIDDASARTLPGERLLTPAYAAPEHILGEPAGTHTDVYALGVVLYELLAGQRPFESISANPRVLARAVLDREPPKPSSLARDGGSRRAAWADLDAMCLTAMHRDVQRRYASVEALVRDIDRFFEGRPLEARPDSLRYRAGKFVARNRRGVVGGAVAALGAATMAAAFARRLAGARDVARAEAERTARVQAFMMNVFAGGDETVGPADDLRVVTLMDRGVREAAALDRDPALQAELFATLGTLYRKLGKLERADELLQRALDVRTAAFGAQHRDVGETFVALALLRADQARYDDAGRLARDGYAIVARALPEGHPSRAKALFVHGRVLEERGDYAGATQLLEDAVRLQRAGGDASADLALSLAELANTHFYAGRYDAADAINEELLAMYRRRYGDRHALVADALFNLGAVRFEKGEYAAAEGRQREALEITRAWYGEDHPATASALTLLAQSLAYQGRHDEAAALLEPALAIATRAFGPDHPRVASVLQRLGKVALERGDLDAAEAHFARTAAIHRATFRDEHQLIANALSNLGTVYAEQGDFVRAESVLREAVDRYARALSAEHTHTGIARIKLGRALLRRRRFAEALVESKAGHEIVQRQPGHGAVWLAMARDDAAEAEAALGSPERRTP